MKKTFCVKSISLRSKKWAFGLKPCLKVVLHGASDNGRAICLLCMSGLFDPNFAKFVITS